jgi:hypothetical protein
VVALTLNLVAAAALQSVRADERQGGERGLHRKEKKKRMEEGRDGDGAAPF